MNIWIHPGVIISINIFSALSSLLAGPTGPSVLSFTIFRACSLRFWQLNLTLSFLRRSNASRSSVWSGKVHAARLRPLRPIAFRFTRLKPFLWSVWKRLLFHGGGRLRHAVLKCHESSKDKWPEQCWHSGEPRKTRRNCFIALDAMFCRNYQRPP